MGAQRRTVVVVAAVLLALLWFWPGAAQARFYNPPGKAGPFMFNLKIGGIAGFSPDANIGGTADQFLLQLELGVALDPDRQAYLLFPLTFQLGGAYGWEFGHPPANYNVVMVPLGFQYDIPIRRVPGLYLYPRVQAGYAAFIWRGDYVDPIYGPVARVTEHFGFVAPEFGVKYVLKQRWNFGGEPFSLPIFFNGDGVRLNYRLTFYAGVNF